MKLVKADMWEMEGLKVITTNESIRRDGKLVMGRGAALEASMRYQELAAMAGNRIRNWKLEHGDKPYKLLFLEVEPWVRIGLFQVKYAWNQRASTDLIEQSTRELKRFAEGYEKAIVLNYPGIGNGGLTPALVEPIIQVLPDNVTVVYK